jgi:hypothetical protein
MTVGITDEYRDELIELIGKPWHKAKRTFTAKELQELIGKVLSSATASVCFCKSCSEAKQEVSCILFPIFSAVIALYQNSKTEPSIRSKFCDANNSTSHT